jgi:iron complex outermembrane recepter protein
LKNLPVANANGVPSSNNANGFAPGASSISLRGFDASATLVLIDGRRVTPYPIGTGGDGTQAFFDLNSIPLAAIESIEILKDGASTTYGADAVAGVVNIKFRHDYCGAESSVEYGNTLDKDSGQANASLLFGVGDGTTNVTGVLNYHHRNAIFLRDRGFSNFTFSPSSNSSPGNFQVSRDAVIAAEVSPGQLPDRETFFAIPPDFTNGSASPRDYTYSRRRIQSFDFSAFAGSFPESERYGGFVNFDHKVFSDQLVIYGDAFYENVQTRNELAPSPSSFFEQPGETTVAIPPHARGPVVGGPSYQETGLAVGSFNPFNPFQQIISGGSRYRLAEFPERVELDTTKAFLSTLGVKGDKLFDGTWGYDGAFRYSEVRDTTAGTFASRSRFNRILNAADPIFDPTSPEFIGTTVPYNPFGDFHVPIPFNSAGIAFATIHPHDVQLSKLTTLDFTLYTTSLFKLPAGGVGFAIGGQFRREHIGQDADQSSIDGDILGIIGNGTFTVAGRKSFGIYGETDLPIFSPANSIPSFRALEFTASARFEDYLNNDTNILVPKVGMRWQPFDESLTIRSTWGEGFREPSLFELHNSPASFFQRVTDKKTGITDNETATLLNSNPNLSPEDSRNFTAGIVYTPKFVSGLTVSIDFFDIERHDVVGAPNADDVIKRELKGKLFPGEAVLRDSNGFVVEIIEPYENNGGELARGIDFGLDYQWKTPYGTFSSLTQVTWLESFHLAQFAGAPALEVRGTGVGGFANDAYLKWKGKSRLDWAWKGFDLNTTVTYTDGFHEILFTDPSFPDGKKEHWVKQTFFVDVQGSYSFAFAPPVENNPVAGYSKDAKAVAAGNDRKSLESASAQTANEALPCWKKLLNNRTITVGCNDVFGQDPPLAFLGNFNYPDFIYDSTGRFVYVSLKKKF